MASHPMDFSSLESAIEHLKHAMDAAEAHPEDEVIRDGAIQRFEYTHELSMKFIKRVLETLFGDSVDTMTYKDLLRTAAERELISNVEQWFVYRDARNKTSHTYDANVASEIFRVIPSFFADASQLLSACKTL